MKTTKKYNQQGVWYQYTLILLLWYDSSFASFITCGFFVIFIYLFLAALGLHYVGVL